MFFGGPDLKRYFQSCFLSLFFAMSYLQGVYLLLISWLCFFSAPNYHPLQKTLLPFLSHSRVLTQFLTEFSLLIIMHHKVEEDIDKGSAGKGLVFLSQIRYIMARSDYLVQVTIYTEEKSLLKYIH